MFARFPPPIKNSFTPYPNEVHSPGVFPFMPTTGIEIENVKMSSKPKKCDISTFTLEALQIIRRSVSLVRAK